MFASCMEIEFLNLSNFDTSNVIDMSWMFNKCYKLKKIEGISNFNVNKVTKIESMLNACKNLTNLDKSKFKSYFYPNKINNKKQGKNEKTVANSQEIPGFLKIL